MAEVKYDPELHKGYVRLIKGERAMMFPPAVVPKMRLNGWKTVKDWEGVMARRARKAVAGMSAADANKYISDLYWKGRGLGAYADMPPEISAEELDGALAKVQHQLQEQLGDVANIEIIKGEEKAIQKPHEDELFLPLNESEKTAFECRINLSCDEALKSIKQR